MINLFELDLKIRSEYIKSLIGATIKMRFVLNG